MYPTFIYYLFIFVFGKIQWIVSGPLQWRKWWWNGYIYVVCVRTHLELFSMSVSTQLLSKVKEGKEKGKGESCFGVFSFLCPIKDSFTGCFQTDGNSFPMGIWTRLNEWHVEIHKLFAIKFLVLPYYHFIYLYVKNLSS